MKSRAKVLVTHWVHPEVLEELSPVCDLVANRTLEPLAQDDLMKRARDVRAILAFMPDRLDKRFLDQCPDLRLIAGAFKGCDNVDVDECTARGIWVTVVPDLLTEPTAELGVALLLAVARRLREGDRIVRSGAFQGWRPILYGTGLAGRQVGLVGMGAVGQALAERLRGFSCRLSYHDPKRLTPAREGELKLSWAALPELLAKSDHVVLSVPLTPDMHGLIGDRVLGGMKPGACLVNIGRGSVVDERAVASALRSGRLGGYAADVFECEDLSRPDRPKGIPSELLAPELETAFTPHLGSAVEETRLAISRSAAGSILEFLRGGTPSHAVNRPLAALRDGTSQIAPGALRRD